MKHGSLFSGIGGFDLASRWMGWTNVFTCEIEEFPRTILKHHFPEAIHYEDIKRTDFTVHRGQIDILTGGFPCQPFSVAGKRLGKNDERHLWPEMYRAIREIRPRFIVGENVRGLLNWSDGLVLDEVYADLEGEGYEVITFVLPAAGINAPHRRDRVWIVAHSNDIRSNQPKESTEQQRRAETRATGKESYASDTSGERCGRRDQRSEADQRAQWQMDQDERHNADGVRCEVERCCADAPNANLQRCEERHTSAITSEAERFDCEEDHQRDIANVIGSGWTQDNEQHASGEFQYARTCWIGFPSQSPVCRGNDGIPARLDGITFPKWRRESIKAYGNAIVPQIAYRIFRSIEATINTNTEAQHGSD